jgi:hypothetical protein
MACFPLLHRTMNMHCITALTAAMKNVFLLSLLVLNLFRVVDAQSNDQNGFINPGPPGPAGAYYANMVWSLGSTETIKWKTNYPNYTIEMWQQVLNSEGGAIGPSPTVFCNAEPLICSVTF